MTLTICARLAVMGDWKIPCFCCDPAVWVSRSWTGRCPKERTSFCNGSNAGSKFGCIKIAINVVCSGAVAHGCNMHRRHPPLTSTSHLPYSPPLLCFRASQGVPPQGSPIENVFTKNNVNHAVGSGLTGLWFVESARCCRCFSGARFRVSFVSPVRL